MTTHAFVPHWIPKPKHVTGRETLAEYLARGGKIRRSLLPATSHPQYVARTTEHRSINDGNARSTVGRMEE